MKLFVSVDMEGLAGIAHPRQVHSSSGNGDSEAYDRSCQLMAGEVNAIVEEALAVGIESLVVNDSHWQMRNLRADELHPLAQLISGDKPFGMTEGIDSDKFDCAAFIGYHAGAGHPKGAMAHTISSSVVDLRVNGNSHNEAGLNAIRLGHHGVPVILVAGDDALADEVASSLPWAVRVVVKKARGTSSIASMSPSSARNALAAGLRQAVSRIDEMKTYEVDAPIRGEIDFRLPVMADFAALVPGVTRVNSATVAYETNDGETFHNLTLSLIRLAGVPSL